MIACLLSLSNSITLAQGSFKTQSGSAYKDGSVPNASSGISKFDPQSTDARRSPSFGEPSGMSAFPPASSRAPQQDFSNQSSIGESSDANVVRCTVEHVDVVDFPALETGALVEINIKEGDSVPSGMLIARIDDTLLKHQLRQALVRKSNAYRMANDETSLEAARKQIQLTFQRYETTKKLAAKGARSADEKRTAKYEYEVALLQLEAAKVRQLEARGEAELENARASEVQERIDRHVVKAMFDGQVVDRYKQEGEWVTAGEPVAKIARMDKLYVTGLIRNRQFNPAEVSGKDVVVTVELARNEKLEFKGKIVSIGAKVIQGSGNEFSVKAEITNKMKEGQWVLRQGSSVSMRIMN
jgi:multidrug resistance efflux pump